MDPTASEPGISHFSILGIIQHADPVVQTVLAVLIVCSVACWALILEKAVRIASLRRHIRQLERFAAADPYEETPPSGLTGTLNARADLESRAEDETRAEYAQRLERVMRLAGIEELRRTESGLSFLATVGSTAPFIGLFGTVWGIMHSFAAIAQARDTSLAVVAPGIAEALFATAVGLVAAIPAVVAYNQITVALGRAAERIGVAVVRLANRRADETNIAGAA